MSASRGSPTSREPFSVAALFGEAFALALLRDPLRLLVLPLLLTLPSIALATVWTRFFPRGRNLWDVSAAAVLVLLAAQLVVLVPSLLAHLWAARRTAHLVQGRRVSVGAELEGALGRLVPFAVATALATLAVAGGVLLCFAPGVLAIWFLGFAPVAAVLRSDGLGDAIRRGRAVVRGRFSLWLYGVFLLGASLFAVVLITGPELGTLPFIARHRVGWGERSIGIALQHLAGLLVWIAWVRLYLSLGGEPPRPASADEPGRDV